jgi:8-oxo-dGTP pyrophosphatase MutT (NUDIX family)
MGGIVMQMLGSDEDDAARPPPVVCQKSCQVYRNPFVTVFDDVVAFSAGGTGTYLRIVEKDGLPGVAVLCEHDGRLAFVRVYRYALQEWEWGVVRGFAHGGDPVATALAECDEELGAEPTSLTPLVVMTPNSGLLAGRVHLFHATYDTPPPGPKDTQEVDRVRWYSLPELFSQINEHDDLVVDGFTLGVVAAAIAKRRVTV